MGLITAGGQWWNPINSTKNNKHCYHSIPKRKHPNFLYHNTFSLQERKSFTQILRYKSSYKHSEAPVSCENPSLLFITLQPVHRYQHSGSKCCFLQCHNLWNHYRNIRLSPKETAVLYLWKLLFTYVKNIIVYIGPVPYVMFSYEEWPLYNWLWYF